MNKKDFIALADAIREHNNDAGWVDSISFTSDHLATLARFLASQNPNFNEKRWLDYIAGRCGPNGGKAGHKNSNTRGYLETMTPQQYDACFAQGDSINKI